MCGGLSDRGSGQRRRSSGSGGCGSRSRRTSPKTSASCRSKCLGKRRWCGTAGGVGARSSSASGRPPSSASRASLTTASLRRERRLPGALGLPSLRLRIPHAGLRLGPCLESERLEVGALLNQHVNGACEVEPVTMITREPEVCDAPRSEAGTAPAAGLVC
eukprot:2375975-Rhodomonas_salina.3